MGAYRTAVAVSSTIPFCAVLAQSKSNELQQPEIQDALWQGAVKLLEERS